MRNILTISAAILLCINSTAQVLPKAYGWKDDSSLMCIYEDHADILYTDSWRRHETTLPATEPWNDAQVGSAAAGTRSAATGTSAVGTSTAGTRTSAAGTRSAAAEITTQGGNLFASIGGKTVQLTSDGGNGILNGTASWVYYEEIFGRRTAYRAWWLSPDGKKLCYYRFDESLVPEYPIYSPIRRHLSITKYPKAGDTNPSVKIGIVSLVGLGEDGYKPTTQFLDIEGYEYYGTPFWTPDSQTLLVQAMPRVQQNLDLYAVNVKTLEKKKIYTETYPTWVEWISSPILLKKGLYMARNFETGWEQIYYLSYDGGEFKCLTTGQNSDISLEMENGGNIYFTAFRENRVCRALYRLTPDQYVETLTDPSLNLISFDFSPSANFFTAYLASAETPEQLWVYKTEYASRAWRARRKVESGKGHAGGSPRYDTRAAGYAYKVADLSKCDDFQSYQAEIVGIPAEDGQLMYAKVIYPKDFDSTACYPMHIYLYGGPGTKVVSNVHHSATTFTSPCTRKNGWNIVNTGARRAEGPTFFHDNGIIEAYVDCRISGENGRMGTDLAFKNMQESAIKDFRRWAEYFGAKGYVKADRIGVSGFSFGGATTAMLMLTSSDLFRAGIAGGGVYDWALYDSHYTERYMLTPELNPEGYAASRVMDRAEEYPVSLGTAEPGNMLRLVHGTGDDNVHFENTLLLVDALQMAEKSFELMVYTDGLHGFGGYQGRHSDASDRDFWLKWLK